LIEKLGQFKEEKDVADLELKELIMENTATHKELTGRNIFDIW